MLIFADLVSLTVVEKSSFKSFPLINVFGIEYDIAVK